MRAFHEKREYDSKLKAWQKIYRDLSFAAHWHREIEVLYVVSGSYRIYINSSAYDAKEGDLAVCNSGDIHYCDPREEGSVLYILVFDPDEIRSLYKNRRFLSHFTTAEALREAQAERELDRLLMAIRKELTCRSAYYEEVGSSILTELWALGLRCFPGGEEEEADQRWSLLESFQQLLDDIEVNYANDITLSYAAEKLNYSTWYCSKLFSRLTGMTFCRYVNGIRIEKAVDMLTHTNRSVTDIALSCGFSNTRTFNRVFLDITGATPTAFQKAGGIRDRKEETRPPYIPCTVTAYSEIV